MFSGHARRGSDLHGKPATLPVRPTRALVLHGDPLAIRFLRRSLEARSCTVTSAGDATSGLDLLLDDLLKLDVLVIGLDLPHRDARSLAQLVRGAGGERDLGLVVVTSSPTPALRAELRALGVDAIADLRAGERAVAEIVLGVVASRRALPRAGSFAGGAATAA